MKETWKDIEEFKGIYQVSNLGQIRSIDRITKYKNGATRLTKGVVLSIGKNKLGYSQVGLSKNDKSYSRRVHRLVAQAFIPNTKGYKEVNHIDGDKQNNNVENLEWCSRKQNVKHSIDIGLRKEYYGRRRDRPMIRKLDELGRVTIPKEDRRELGWKHNDEIIIKRENDTFILGKYEPIICKKCKNSQSINNNYCSNCGEKLK